MPENYGMGEKKTKRKNENDCELLFYSVGNNKTVDA